MRSSNQVILESALVARLSGGGGTLCGVASIRLTHTYEHITSTENLLSAWREFVKGKRKKKDVQEFSRYLMKNILELQRDLQEKTYVHGTYTHFRISDPKPRDIHKARVRDRLLHHALYRVLYPYFDTKFIADSYSCRKGKGTHRAMHRFRDFSRKVSRNNTRTCYVLKCDIRKFFASIDQQILTSILERYIEDKHILWLLPRVIESFTSGEEDKGLPLGNLTSQLLVNIYMNEFDQYVKHTLKARYYIRYADDFVIFSHNRDELDEIYRLTGIFLFEHLKLTLHPNKCFVTTLASGCDFLGWVHFPHHRALRTSTKRRMLKVLQDEPSEERLASYVGMLRHGDAFTLQRAVQSVRH